jgi:hypothetical protein
MSDTQARLDAVREAVGHYITALMVDASAVAGCERAMDEAFDALAAELERVTAALLTAKDDLRWQSDYAGPDGRAEAQEAISRIYAALAGGARAAQEDA